MAAGESGRAQKAEQRWGCAAFTGPFAVQSLPDEVLVQCLARVQSRHAYAALRAVCRSWRALMADPLFCKVRRDLGMTRPCLLTLSRPPEQSRGEFLGEFYDPVSDASHCFTCPWPALRQRRVLPAGLAIYSCISVDFEVFLFGGEHSTHIYNPILNAWREGLVMLEPRRDFACGVVGRKIYIAGGLNTANERLCSVEVYDIDKDCWARVSSMPEMRSGCKGQVVNGKFFIVGDQNTFAPNRRKPPDTLVYDPSKDSWRLVAALPDERWYFQTLVWQGQLCVVGGGRKPHPATQRDQTCWAAPLLYHEKEDEWRLCGFEVAERVKGSSGWRCSSSICTRLRNTALSHKVMALGVGDALCVIPAGEHQLVWSEGLREKAAASCEDVWCGRSHAQGRGKGRGGGHGRRRLRHPWHGHVHGVALVMHI